MAKFLPTYKINDSIYYDNDCLFLFTWSLDLEQCTLPKFVQNILSDVNVNDSKIFLLASEEYEISSDFKKILTDEFKKKLLKKRIELHFLFGSSSIDYYTKDNSCYHDPTNNLFVHLWPTFWLYQTLNLSFKQNLDYFFLTEQIEIKKTEIKYPFITMNNVGKYSRCLLMDLLTKNNLINLGAVSWHNFVIDTSYKWQWTTSILSMRSLSDQDRYYKNKHLNQFIPPKEFSQSFMSIVSETTQQTVFITEKTAIPLLFKQPFLVQGAVGFHNYLKNLGFKLYDEVFDYSFDLIEDLETRTQMILDNIKNNLDKDLFELYQKIKPKLDYNQSRLIEIFNNKEHCPSIVNDISIINERYTFDSIYFLNEDL